jgi:hypothetical protein
MRLDNKLNLITEIETDDKATIFVHSTPISRDVFEKYFLVISKTFASIISEGLSFISGPRVAAMMLKKIASDQGVWEGRAGVEVGLISEIRRLSNVIMPSEKGWNTVPFQDAIDKQLLHPDDIAEVEGLICFFICASAMSRRTEIASVLDRMAVWGSSTTLLNSTAFAASLPTSTETETSLPSVNTLSVPI